MYRETRIVLYYFVGTKEVGALTEDEALSGKFIADDLDEFIVSLKEQNRLIKVITELV